MLGCAMHSHQHPGAMKEGTPTPSGPRDTERKPNRNHTSRQPTRRSRGAVALAFLGIGPRTLLSWWTVRNVATQHDGLRRVNWRQPKSHRTAERRDRVPVVRVEDESLAEIGREVGRGAWFRRHAAHSAPAATPTRGLVPTTNPRRRAARPVRCDPGQSRATRNRAGGDAHEWRVSERSGLPPRRSGRSLRSCTAGGRWSLERARRLRVPARNTRYPHGVRRRGDAHGSRTRQRTVQVQRVRLTRGTSVARQEPSERQLFAIGEAPIDRQQSNRSIRTHRDLPVRGGGPTPEQGCPSRSIEWSTVRPSGRKRRSAVRCWPSGVRSGVVARRSGAPGLSTDRQFRDQALLGGCQKDSAFPEGSKAWTTVP
jgi:hypothetical protein